MHQRTYAIAEPRSSQSCCTGSGAWTCFQDKHASAWRPEALLQEGRSEDKQARLSPRSITKLDCSRALCKTADLPKACEAEIMKHAMKVVSITSTFVCLLLASGGVAAGDVGTAIGGGAGGAAGALIGSQVGGKNGAVIGGALGGGVGAAATTSGSGKTGAIVGGAVGGGAGAAVGQKLGGSTGAVVGAGAGGAVGASVGKSLTEKGSAQPKVVAQPAPAAVVVRADGVARAHAPSGRGNFCPPGQAKKGRC
jgi:hypothetical protein